MSKCIIMCAGSYTPGNLCRRKGDFLIAADNGLSYLDAMGVEPDYVIGDYDSLEQREEGRLKAFEAAEPAQVKTLPVEKDDTDSMAAVREGLKRGFQKFLLFGALGGSRLDHTIANLQTLNFIRENGAEGFILDEHCLLTVLKNGTVEIPEGYAGGFSLFALEREIHGVTIRGMKYNVENVTITNAFPIGVSNHIAAGSRAAVTVEEGSALLFLSWEDERSHQLILDQMCV